MLTKILFAILVVLQVLDVISTNLALKHGAVEANPVVRRFMGCFGRLWWLPKVSLGLAGGWLLLGAGTLGAVLLGMLYASHGWVIWQNFRLVEPSRIS